MTPYWQSIVLYLLSVTEGEAGGSGQAPRLQGLSVVSFWQYGAICLSEHPYITSAIKLGGWFKKMANGNENLSLSTNQNHYKKVNSKL